MLTIPKAFPPESRRRAVELARSSQRPVAKVASVGISESCRRRWMAQDDVEAGRREGLTADERRELVAMRRRNRVLEMELEILKRASAYFATENVLPRQGSGWSESLPPTVSPSRWPAGC